MRLLDLGIAGVLLVTGACPGPGVTDQQGTSTGGGGSGDVLAFTVQPSNATAGEVITPAIRVAVNDTLGNPDSSFTSSITITIGTNPVGGFISGTTSVAPVGGVASFGDLSIDKAGSGYTFSARATGATSKTSASFNIVAAP
jgi:hypothetical protein